MRIKLIFFIFLFFWIGISNTSMATNSGSSLLSYDTSIVQDTVQTTKAKKKKKGLGKIFSAIGNLFKKKKKKQANVKKDTTSTGQPASLPQHYEELQKYGDFIGTLESHWDSIHLIKHRKHKSNTKETHKQVFGFHPYWMGSSYKSYNYKLLSAVAYFSYELNPRTGKHKSIRNWNTTALIDSAKANNCKVYLTVTNFTNYKNRIFLKNKKAQKTSISVLGKLLKKRGASGVVLDFEQVPKDVTSEFTNYVKSLYECLKENGMSVVITLPAMDPGNAYDVVSLSNYVESFIIMGYDFYGAWSKIAGPEAPLNIGKIWDAGSVEYAVNTYLEKGVSKDKLILAVPYYGNEWRTVNAEIPSKKVNFINHLSYRSIKKKYSQSPDYEPISETAYLNFPKKNRNTQLWFDDATSLKKKYDFINNTQLAGVAIWALGYDNGHLELWDALDQKFGGTSSSDKSTNTSVISNEIADSTSWYSHFANIEVLKALLFLLIFVFASGFLLSLRNKSIREIVFDQSWSKILFLLGIPFVILILTISFGYLFYGIILFFGIFIGYGLYFVKSKTDEEDFNINRIP